MASTKARLPKHDFPVHGHAVAFSLTFLSYLCYLLLLCHFFFAELLLPDSCCNWVDYFQIVSSDRFAEGLRASATLTALVTKLQLASDFIHGATQITRISVG